MRNSALLLILINICLAMWIYSTEMKRTAGQILPPENPQVRKLMLLSELAEPLRANKPKKVSTQASSRNQSKTTTKASAPVREQVAKDSDVSESKLRSESQPVSATRSETNVSPTQCYTYGPFEQASKARRAVRLLSREGVSVSRRSSQEQEAYGYRVFIPPLPSRQRAYAVANELKTAGVKDYFVITNPSDKVDAIALGLFTQKSGALKRVAQLRNLGYQANIEIRYRDKEIFWLDYQARQGQISSQVYQEAGEGVRGIQLLEGDC